MMDIMSDSSFVKSFKAAQSKSLNAADEKENKSKLIPAIPDLKTKSIALVEPIVDIVESSNKTIRISESIKKNSTELIVQEASANGYNLNTDNAPNTLSIEGILSD